MGFLGWPGRAGRVLLAGFGPAGLDRRGVKEPTFLLRTASALWQAARWALQCPSRRARGWSSVTNNPRYFGLDEARRNRLFHENLRGNRKNPPTFRMPIGLRCMPNCPHATTSNSSSRVPKPPGKAIKASDSDAISALRSCMLDTTCSLVTVSKARVHVPGQGLGNDAGEPCRPPASRCPRWRPSGRCVRRHTPARAHAPPIDLAQFDGGPPVTRVGCRSANRKTRRCCACQ